jgi:hypothetical protein
MFKKDVLFNLSKTRQAVYEAMLYLELEPQTIGNLVFTVKYYWLTVIA